MDNNPNTTNEPNNNFAITTDKTKITNPGTSQSTTYIPLSKSKQSKLKPWMKITIGVFVLIATFVIGIVVGIFVQAIVQSNIDSDSSSYIDNDRPVFLKPMLYLYPETSTEVTVKLGHPEFLTTTYPKYDKSWTVLAEPNGTLRDNSGREFYGLYWEGSGNPSSIHEDGFVVAGTNTAQFLEEKLSLLGLTEREANEFIIYWLPELEKNPYNYIRFETKEEIENYMPLEVSPKPDSTIRIIMDYKPLAEPIEVFEQHLETPNRIGFTVVEWGGTEIGENLVH